MSSAVDEGAILPESELPFWRSTPSNGRGERVGKYGIDVGERGVFDTRNKLNELTGREWTYFLNSIWITAYPPVANEHGFDLRKVHPSPKPPKLMRDLILFFTKGGDWILDPFAGVGGTLIGGSICERKRNSVGIEINQDYIDAYKQVCKAEGFERQKLICGDARELQSIREVAKREFDLILTDPPYSDLMARPKSGQKKKLYNRDDATPFSSNPADLGNLPYKEFVPALVEILEQAVTRLKDKKYLVVFCRDLQPKPGEPFLLHADMIKAICEIPTIEYRGMKIWHDQASDLYPFGYPYAFVMNQMHQYVLIFRKVS